LFGTAKQGEPTMAKYTWDHIHLRTTNPEATAQWYESKLGAEVIRTMQQGKPRIDLKLGGANIFIAPVAAGDGVNPPPTTPYQGLDHFGLTVTGIDAIAGRDRRDEDIGPAELEVDARLALLHGADHLGTELAFVPLGGRFRIGGSQMDVIPGEFGHGRFSVVVPRCE
jgi:catechol 2,3-dioxygenase-like lactoylglutathione lyase family enzyme